MDEQQRKAHWERVCDLRLIEVDYEQLVADPEGESRRMVEFIELDWDPACLRYYENPRIVRTASYAQVREPVYQTSIGRWRNYETQLAPLVEALREAGYVEGS